MSILIKGMEMPTDRSRWVVIYPDGKVEYSDKTDEWETLDKGAVPVPPHGRLIDADEIIQERHQHYEYLSDTFYVTVRDIELAPTIIPAEPCNNLSKPCKEDEP